ncbi:LysE family translocator (plasmid) [Haloferax prahovense]|uniref:LysE family translocator n=1 Tax=Haloferax prahovense TaxID=381852 RepID=UPI003C73CDB1
MIGPSSLLAFISAAVVVIMAPGPDTIYALTQSIKSGRIAGLVAGFGTATGVIVHTTAAVLGLSALLQTSALAYNIVKYVGVIYLMYLGIQMFRNDEEFELETALANEDRSLFEAYKKAVIVNVSNPKVAVFVLAFFPQFIPEGVNTTVNMSILGILYATLSLAYLTGVALFATRVRHILLGSRLKRRLIQYASGSVLLGFGAKLVLEKRPTQ